MKSVEVEERIERESVASPDVEKRAMTMRRAGGERPKSIERFHPLWELTLARVRELLREPEVVFWVFIFPLLLVFALGIAFRNTGPQKIRIAVEQSQANAAATSRLADALAQSKELDVVRLSPDEATRQLRSGKVEMVVRLSNRDTQEAQATGDGAASSSSSSAQTEATTNNRLSLPGSLAYQYDPTRSDSRQARMVVDDALQRAAGRQDVAHPQDEMFTEPGGRYIDFLVPGLLGMNLMGSGMWGIGFAVVSARTKKLLKRFAATPMRRSHYLLSFVLSRLIFLALEVAVVIAFAWVTFGYRVRGSLVEMSLLLVLGALTFAGIGLLVAARPKTIEGVSGLMNLVMMPMWLLSGTFFTSTRFPGFLQPFIKALPLTMLNDSLRSVMNEGAPLVTSWIAISILLAWCVVSFLVALKIFRWQ